MADESKQKVLLGVLVAGAIGYFGYGQLYRPRAERVAALETRLEALETQNETARILTARDGSAAVEARLDLFREQLVRVEGLIPSSEEVPDLLDAVSAEAGRAGVELTLIQPTGATQEDFYVRRTYALAVAGGYHQVAEFLTRVASLPRIVTPIDLNVDVEAAPEPGGGSPRLQARFAVETYVIPSTPLPAPEAEGTHAE